jgi:hypothetical protein
MENIVFHSLYRDANLKTLKHSLLYFDNITIPSDALACNFDSHIHFLQLIPDDVYEQIDYLKNQNLVKVYKFLNNDSKDLTKYNKAVVEGINRLGRERFYSRETLLEVCNYLELNYNHPDVFEIVDAAIILIAAIILMEFSVYEKICCIDNIILYDTLNLAVKGVLNFSKDSIHDNNIEFRRIKKNLLAQKVLALNLPSFEFKTFDDVLEIREKHRSELLALDNQLDDLAGKIELPPFDPGFSEAVDRLISRRIQPEIDDLTKSITFSPSRLARRIYDPIKNFAIGFGFSNNFPAYTKEIAIAGASLTIIEGIFKNYNETKKKIKESPYNILISIKNK